MTNKKITTEDLARMVNEGFEKLATKDNIKELKSKMATKDDIKELKSEMHKEFGEVRLQLSGIENQIKDFVERDEFEDLMSRVKVLELKLGIESGK